MADFLKYSMHFEGNQSGTLDRKRVADPPGYQPSAARDAVSTSVSSSKEMEQLEAKQTALYGRAQGVFKNVGFMCFMMWMSGSQIHLFSIMMTVSGIYQPLMAIMNSRQMFPPEASEGGKLNILVPRMIFILIQGAGLAFGAWKLHTMGLLPTHASDFVSSLSVPVNKEFSSAGTSLV